jgi:nickel-type superoxide dismutase maturation protease
MRAVFISKMLRALRITGNSLYPLFQEGDFVLVSKIPFYFRSPRAGDIVIFPHPVFGTMIKRVESVVADSQVFVTGTNADSLDSRQLGPIPISELVGKVIWHIRKPTAGP